MNYYNEIKQKLIDEEAYKLIKDYSKEQHKVKTYFEIGKILNDVGKKDNKRTLFRIKQFYTLFKDQKVSTMSTQLSWSHYSELLSLNNINSIKYYIHISETQKKSVLDY